MKKEEDKKGLSTKAKFGIGAGVLAIGSIIAAAILTKGKTLKTANFAEHIEFVKANTMEEAAEFAKKNFGVKNFDFADDIEFANWVNEGLTNLSNRFKGKANIVENLRFATPEELAEKAQKGSRGIAFCDSFAKLGENTTIKFNRPRIQNAISEFKKLLDSSKIKLEKNANGESEIVGAYVLGADRKTHSQILELADKFYRTPEKFTRFDAIHGTMLFDDYVQSIKYFEKNKLSILEKQIFSDKESVELLKRKNISVNIDDYKNLEDKELSKRLTKILTELVNCNPVCGTATVRGNSKFDILYHEMGHHLHAMNTSLKDQTLGCLSKKSVNAFGVDFEKQQSAGTISWYAQKNPKEFVAEVFNALCAGRKLTDDVMKLYQYYKGPMLPNI